MNTHSTAHLYGQPTVRTSEEPDALVIEENGSTLGIFVSRLPAADRIRFLDELAAQAAFLSTVIADREAVRAS